MAHAYCPVCKCYPETLLARPMIGTDDTTGEVSYCEEGIFLNNEGHATNQWEGGAFGVPNDMARLAEEDETPVCGDCFSYVDWIHT